MVAYRLRRRAFLQRTVETARQSLGSARACYRHIMLAHGWLAYRMG